MRFVRVVVACGLAVVACSDGGQTSSKPSLASVPSITDAPELTTTETVGPEPTGVPGVDDADRWCAAWARYGGSLQIVSVALAFGGIDDVEAARIELAAAPAVRAAVADIAAGWPAELDGEREVVLTRLLGPFEGRALRAEAALVAAGATAGDLAALVEQWADVLRSRDPESPTVSIESYPGPLLDLLDGAATAFAANATRFDRDPSLQVDGSRAPATRALLARDCPALASSGVGDAI